MPESTPFDQRTIEVDEQHALYVEQVGNADGIPAVFLHGGPGSGCQPAHRGLFDPARFRAVLFDQRGAGRSTPRRCLQHNTTQHLIADLECIRETLGIERWMVVGGSWGALLAVTYAEAHPSRVTGLVLRAVFLGTAREIEWAFVRGPQTFCPELWRAFVGLLPASEREHPLRAYGTRLMDPDPKIHGPAAAVWHDYERALSVLQPGSLSLPGSLTPETFAGAVPSTPFFEWHYIANDFFLTPAQLLADAGRLAGIPGIIVQGRYDLLCPPRTAHALAERWPDCELRIVEGAGHSLSEQAIGQQVVAAIERLGSRLAGSG